MRESGLETFASSWSIATAAVVCWLFLFKSVFDEDRFHLANVNVQNKFIFSSSSLSLPRILNANCVTVTNHHSAYIC